MSRFAYDKLSGVTSVANETFKVSFAVSYRRAFSALASDRCGPRLEINVRLYITNESFDGFITLFLVYSRAYGSCHRMSLNLSARDDPHIHLIGSLNNLSLVCVVV